MSILRILGFALLVHLAAGPVAADILVPVRVIRAQEVIGPQDLIFHQAEAPGAISDPSMIVGFEAKVALYPGRPVRVTDVGPPAVVDRNDLVTLVFKRGGLQILTEGRALGRGAVGDTIRTMNVASRTTVMGQINSEGWVEVQQ